VQAYNAQAAVDGEAQIIVAHDVNRRGRLRSWCRDRCQSRPISAASPSSCRGRRLLFRANLETLENRNIDPTWRPPGQDALPARSKARPPPRCRRRARRRTDARRGHAREDQGRGTRALPAAQATARAGIRQIKQARASASSCCAASRKCAPSGHYLHRPQSPEAVRAESSTACRCRGQPKRA